MKIAIREKSIKKAAKFIYKKNEVLLKSLEDIEQSIYILVYDVANRLRKDSNETKLISTMGVWVIGCLEEDDYAVIEVLVDPSVSKDYEYTYL